MRRLLFIAVFVLSGCTGIPEGIEPVENFELEPYLGTWYEIARLDHSFERGLSNVTANYSLREDGGVHVVNRGYLAEKDKWDEAEGKAYFIGEPGCWPAQSFVLRAILWRVQRIRAWRQLRVLDGCRPGPLLPLDSGEGSAPTAGDVGRVARQSRGGRLRHVRTDLGRTRQSALRRTIRTAWA